MTDKDRNLTFNGPTKFKDHVRPVTKTGLKNQAASSDHDAASPRREDESGATAQQGALKWGTLGQVLYRLSQDTGAFEIRIQWEKKKIELTLRDQMLIDITSSYIHAVSLGAILIREGKITPAENKVSVSRAVNAKMKHGQMLVKMGLLDKSELKEAIRRQKLAKLRYVLIHPRPQGTFEAIRRPAAGGGEELGLHLPIGPLLFHIFMEELPLSIPLDYLLNRRKSRAPLIFGPQAPKILKWLQSPPDCLEWAKRLSGKTLSDLKLVVLPEDYPMCLRLACLLTVLGDEPAKEKEMIRSERPPRAAPEPIIAPLMPQRSRASSATSEKRSLKGVLEKSRFLIQTKNYRRALSLLRRFEKTASDSAEFATLLACAEYGSLSQFDLSVVTSIKKRLEQALILDDQNELAHLFLGKIYKSLNQDKAASEHFNAALRLNPDNEETRREIKLFEIRQRTLREQRLLD